MSGACAAAAAAGVCFGARARAGAPARRVRPVVALRQPTRGLARRGSPTRVRPNLVPRASPRAGQGPVAGDALPRRGFAPAAATRGRRAVARSARPEDPGKAQSGDAGEGSETNEPTTEATPHPDSGASSASSDDADAASAEPPREEIKYKPPGVSKRRSATKTVPIVVNPVPPSGACPEARAPRPKDEDAADPGDAAAAAEAGASVAADAVDVAASNDATADVAAADAGAGRAPPSGTSALREPPPADDPAEKRNAEEAATDAETAALRSLSGSAAEPSAAAREAFQTAKDAFKAASAALDADAKTASSEMAGEGGDEKNAETRGGRRRRRSRGGFRLFRLRLRRGRIDFTRSVRSFDREKRP